MILRAIMVAFVLALSLVGASGQATVYQDLPPLGERVQLACNFLRTLYNSTLGLVSETSDSTRYHIASDNLLAQKALRPCDTSMATSIETSIGQYCGNCYNGMHEALLGVEITLPVHAANIMTIANTSSHTILWEVHNGTGTLSPSDYADVAVYTALEMIRHGNQTGISEMGDYVNVMFDGRGLVDEPYQNGPPGELGIYQTYKLALYIHLQSKQYGVYPGLVERLLRMQGPEGGFHTGYDERETYAGTEMNAETTSAVIIVIDQLTTQQTPRFPFPFFPSAFLGQILPYIAIAIIAGTAVVLGFVFWEERRKKRPSQSLSRTIISET